MKKEYYTGEEDVQVNSKEELALMTKFMVENCDTNRDSYSTATIDYEFPIVTYAREGNEWGWNRGDCLKGGELSVKEFLSKYEQGGNKLPTKEGFMNGVIYTAEGEALNTVEDIANYFGIERKTSILGDLGLFDKEKVAPKTEYTTKHYDTNYQLTKKDIKQGFVRLDTYKVNAAWGMNDVDKTGVAFHCLKTLNRIPRNKNPLERELRALITQAKCWAESKDIDLSDMFK